MAEAYDHAVVTDTLRACMEFCCFHAYFLPNCAVKQEAQWQGWDRQVDFKSFPQCVTGLNNHLRVVIEGLEGNYFWNWLTELVKKCRTQGFSGHGSLMFDTKVTGTQDLFKYVGW